MRVTGNGDTSTKKRAESSPTRRQIPKRLHSGMNRKRLQNESSQRWAERDREVLIRSYLDGHTAERIQQEMGMTETQFRLIKSRGKARFAHLAKSRLAVRDT